MGDLVFSFIFQENSQFAQRVLYIVNINLDLETSKLEWFNGTHCTCGGEVKSPNSRRIQIQANDGPQWNSLRRKAKVHVEKETEGIQGHTEARSSGLGKCRILARNELQKLKKKENETRNSRKLIMPFWLRRRPTLRMSIKQAKPTLQEASHHSGQRWSTLIEVRSQGGAKFADEARLGERDVPDGLESISDEC